MAQAKGFVEIRHKMTITKLVSCFDRERGIMWDISTESPASLIRQ